MKTSIITLITAIASMLVACGDGGSGTSVDAFDRRPMITAVTNTVIIPGYTRVTAVAEDLARKVQALDSEPTTDHIVSLRNALDSLNIAWQAVVLFDFGPADGMFGSLAENIATFPVDAAGVESLVAAGDTAFADFRRDTRGLVALDYLLGRGTVQETRDSFTGSTGAGRQRYLRAVANAIHKQLSDVLAQWTGSYREQFVSRTGTDAGSSVSLLYNHLNIGFELLKNFKIGLPLGKRAGQTTTEPTRVEAYYRGASLSLARAHFEACVRLWHGRGSDGAVFPSFRAYLATVPNGQRLIDDTESQIARVESAFATIGTNQSLSDLIISQPALVEQLHTELQKLTRFYKSEMSSLLGIAITYSSGDGD